MVTVETYAESENSTPNYATLLIKDAGVTKLTSKTVFNILKDTDLRLSSILKTDQISIEESQNVQFPTSAFTVNRASFKMNRFNVYSALSDASTNVEFIRSTYNMGKMTTMMNMVVQVAGYVWNNVDVGSSLYIDNAEFDLYATLEGITNRINCNFPEAILTHTFELHNIRAYNSQPRTRALINEVFIFGDPNITVSNFTFEIYGSALEDVAPLEVSIPATCIPQDGRTRITHVKDSYMTLPENPDSNKFVQMYSEFTEGSDRNEIIIYENNYHENIVDSIYAMFDVYLQPNTEIRLINNTFVNVSGLYGGAYIYNAGTITMKDNTYINSTNFGFGLANFEETASVTIDGYHIENVISSGTSDEYMFYVYLVEGSDLTVSGLNLTNTEVNLQSLIYLDGPVNKVTISNSTCENIKVGSDIAMFALTKVYIVSIDNLVFKNIQSSSDSDSNNKMINIGTLYLSSSENSTIQNIDVNNSKIGLFTLGGVAELPTETRALTVSNVAYTNSNFINPVTLMNIEGVQTTEDFIISATNLEFNTLSFTLGGYLINMQSQMTNSFVIADSSASNIIGGSIKAEAFNKQDTSVTSKLTLSNFTTTSINAQYGSFMILNEGGELIIEDSNIKDVF